MVSFGSPLWLTGLIALILVWWLHRRSSAPPPIQVPALFLWRGTTVPGSSAMDVHKAHPLWRLRALVLSILLFSLSEISLSPLYSTKPSGPEPENAALSQISLRRSLQNPEQVIGIAGVTFNGEREVATTLTISAATESGTVEVANQVLVPGPGSPTNVSFGVTNNVRDIIATLEPGDAAPNDDIMVLPMQATRPVTTTILGSCDATLVQALAAHPGISVVTNPERGELTIACAPNRDAFATLAANPPAILWFGTHAVPERTQPRWLEWAGTVTTESRYVLYPTALPAPAAMEDARVFLRDIDSNTPLITASNGYLEVYLDLIPAPHASTSATLALFATILDTAMDRPLLDPIVSSQTKESNVVEAENSRSRSDLTGVLAAAALLLVILELVYFSSIGAGVTRANP